MGSAQLSPQCVENLFLRKTLRNAEKMHQLLFEPTRTKIPGKLNGYFIFHCSNLILQIASAKYLQLFFIRQLFHLFVEIAFVQPILNYAVFFKFIFGKYFGYFGSYKARIVKYFALVKL